LAQLFRAVRLCVNYFQPSFKLLGKDSCRYSLGRHWPGMRAVAGLSITGSEEDLRMTDPTRSPPANLEAATPRPVGGAPLSEAQRAFAELLGRLLAQRWQEERRGQETADDGKP
jgi:hypothetical protein